jgi:hypothetical protein
MSDRENLFFRDLIYIKRYRKVQNICGEINWRTAREIILVVTKCLCTPRRRAFWCRQYYLSRKFFPEKTKVFPVEDLAVSANILPITYFARSFQCRIYQVNDTSLILLNQVKSHKWSKFHQISERTF